jgi:hypothetical protein
MYTEVFWREEIAARQAELRRAGARGPHRRIRSSVARMLASAALKIDGPDPTHSCLEVS